MADSTIKYADKDQLTKLNIKAINTEKNRSVYPEMLEEALENDTNYPVTFSMVHNDVEMRASFSIGGALIWIDMDFEDYLSLPEISLIDTEKGS